MANQIKITKSMKLEAIKAYFEEDLDTVIATVDGVEVAGRDIIEYCDVTLEQLADKANKNKAKAEENKADSNALKEEIFNILTNEYQDADTITSQIEVEDITRSKVIPRLTQLINENRAEKDVIKDGKSKRTVYRRITISEE